MTEIQYDFDGSLRMTEVVEDFFFSPSTGLYVFRHPLYVDERVLAAARELGIEIQASPEKWLVNTPLASALSLLRHLDATALSLPEYFQVRRDAVEAGDDAMLQSLEAHEFIEMLDTVFIHDEHMIHHPAVGDGFSGEKIPVNTPTGRYGWTHPDDIDMDSGLPTRVRKARNLRDQTLKYWDTHTEIGRSGVLMAVRGYVTSVGKMSLDLGFPATAVSHKLTIRECRAQRPAGALDEALLAEAKSILAKYYRALEDKTIHAGPPEWTDEFLAFIDENHAALRGAGDVTGRVLQEDCRDLLGLLRLLAERESPSRAESIRRTSLRLSGLPEGDVSDDLFHHFVTTRRNALQQAAASKASIVFVIGHDNPDTDAIVSALAEAFRQHLIDGQSCTYVPVVPGGAVPGEVARLLGEEFSQALVRSNSDLYRRACAAGRPEWIMVDHSIGPEQPRTRAIIDHHFPSGVALRQQIPRRIIFAGSTTALVALRIYGLGADIPPTAARIFHGATLMDTENRFPGKITPLDTLVMDELRAASGDGDESALYQELMRELISCYDADSLFIRDYKEDWSFFGFAVAKGVRLLDQEYAQARAKLVELARENNAAKNLPLTLVKIVDYADDAATIRRERMHTVFNQSASAEFRAAVGATIITVIEHESPPGIHIEQRGDAIEYWGVGTQLSRKKLAPVLELVVNAFNRFFYSPSTGLYLRRDFLRESDKVHRLVAAHRLGVHIDEQGVVVGNPAELKLLLQELDLLCASPAEYFKAYRDAAAVKDLRMIEHLTSTQYLETLDAIIESGTTLIEHPRILPGESGLTYDGQRRPVHVPPGEPGLIDIARIDLETGLPTEVQDPRQYGTNLWRYWSPDSDCAWALRSTICAYDMPALDLKFHFAEELPRLTIRPCTRKVRPPKVMVHAHGNSMQVDIDE